MENFNFWDSDVWGFFNLLAILLLSLLAANVLKKVIPFLHYSLIPTSVLGGILLLLVSLIYEGIAGTRFFDTAFFGGNGSGTLEILTYHALALGFIATTLKPSDGKMTKERNVEIINTGATTVATYLLQGILGLGITLLASLAVKGMFSAAGVLLPFGFGQGTGQALNWGNVYETENGFVGGRSFGLTIAALGFLSASVGGVIHLNILRRRGKILRDRNASEKALSSEEIQGSDEIPMNGSIDKLTFQLVLIFAVYLIAYLVMKVLGNLLPSLQSILYGFNFLFGVIFASVVKALNNFLRKKKIVEKQYINPFLMTRLSGFFFDLMIVAGVAAIRIDVLKNYWLVIVILALVGALSTYFYNHFVAKTLFPGYTEEQFMVMYGMLTGTASTGIILLREMDPEFRTPAADNLVYQNFPAMIFGFPMMLIAAVAPERPVFTLIVLVGFFAVMNLILFRSKIFPKRKKG
ncbi:MAG: hypothetical protein KBS76_05210 [Ruminococcus sp.]|nr:hypothetical protein [Candidatus Apopatosoma intestinale]